MDVIVALVVDTVHDQKDLNITKKIINIYKQLFGLGWSLY